MAERRLRNAEVLGSNPSDSIMSNALRRAFVTGLLDGTLKRANSATGFKWRVRAKLHEDSLSETWWLLENDRTAAETLLTGIVSRAGPCGCSFCRPHVK